ncbi:MAG: NAD-dependent epimerase/dehydratase family protein [Chloroflexi bacterium]|nr:NAD-dependent epimerase/dehydratase family protein [Chloroflexota bacterium]
MAERTALVTGCAGFIGGYLCERLLAEGYRVVGIDNETTGFRANVPAAVEYLPGDIRDEGVLAEAFGRSLDVVLHAAAQVSNIKSFGDPQSDLDVNVRGTLGVLGKCLAHRVPRLLYASSMAVYGEPAQVPTPETAPCLPLSYYGIGKFAAERYVQQTARRTDLDFAFNVTSFRMFNVYGPRQSLTNPYQGVISVFVANLLQGEPIILYGSGRQSRDFVYIDDIVDAWLAAIAEPRTYGEAINLGTGSDVSIQQLIDTVTEIFGRKGDYPIERRPTLSGDQFRIAADIAKARELLGWTPRVKFAAGLARTVEWARRSGVYSQLGWQPRRD